MSNKDQTVVRMDRINKSYSGVRVLYDVDFDLRRGEIHGLVGKNGAGKSTLMKILYGVEDFDSGNIQVNEEKIIPGKTGRQREHIAMIFQELSLVPTLTVAQNIFLCNIPTKKNFFLDVKKCNILAMEMLKKFQMDINPVEIVGNLSTVEKQVIEIIKALVQRKLILIMDEPTTSFTFDQVKAFFEIIRSLKNYGVSIIYVSHNLRDIFDLCDRVTVLKDGRRVLTSRIQDLSMQTLIEKITGGGSGKVGKIRKRISPIKKNENKEPLLRVQNIQFENKFANISFEVYPGEILGIAGLTGSGKTELLETIYGINRQQQGEVFVNGEKITEMTPKKATQQVGVALVPDERQTKGLVLEHPVIDNITLSILDRLRNVFLLNRKEQRQIARQMIEKLNIVASNIYQNVISLSGGNQQKVVLAKNLVTNSSILLLDDPTVGIDIESKREVINIVREYVSSGHRCVILVSSELEVLADVCDRVLIMKKGRIVDEIENREENPLTETKLMSLIQ